MRFVNGFAAVLLGFMLIAGCSQPSVSEPPQAYTPEPAVEAPVKPKVFNIPEDCGGTLTAEQRMYLELIQKMVEQGQYYGALANLQQLEKSAAATPQTVYLRAEALRKTGQYDAAAGEYQKLFSGCMAGYGLHGYGLLASARGDQAIAEDYLQRASRERPVDANIHNDFGVVLMLRGRYAEANKEFMTALELDRSNRLPVENLIVLLLLEKQEQQAELLAKESGVSSQDFERLSQRAERVASQPSL